MIPMVANALLTGAVMSMVSPAGGETHIVIGRGPSHHFPAAQRQRARRAGQ
jgi:hypothetical protein